MLLQSALRAITLTNGKQRLGGGGTLHLTCCIFSWMFLITEAYRILHVDKDMFAKTAQVTPVALCKNEQLMRGINRATSGQSCSWTLLSTYKTIRLCLSRCALIVMSTHWPALAARIIHTVKEAVRWSDWRRVKVREAEGIDAWISECSGLYLLSFHCGTGELVWP